MVACRLDRIRSAAGPAIDERHCFAIVSPAIGAMSGLGHSRQIRGVCRMSASHPASDVSGPGRHFAFGPEPEVSNHLARAVTTLEPSGRSPDPKGVGHPDEFFGRHRYPSARFFLPR